MFIYSFPRPVTLLVEFEGVDDVLPDAVEAAGRHGGDQPGERDECRDLERKHKEMPFPESAGRGHAPFSETLIINQLQNTAWKRGQKMSTFPRPRQKHI